MSPPLGSALPRCAVAALLLLLAAAPSVDAREVTVPVDVGVGPAVWLIGNYDGFRLEGPVWEDQRLHFGLRLSIAAILDQEFLDRHGDVVPKKYHRYLQGGREVRYRPAILALVPESLLISPKVANTAIYGATWRLLHVGIAPIQRPFRFSIGAGLLFTYAFIDSDAFESPTHFLRPGIGLNAEIGIPLGERVAVSLGWDEQLYIPQAIAGPVFEGPGDRPSIWHMSVGYVKLHVRFPYTTTL